MKRDRDRQILGLVGCDAIARLFVRPDRGQ